MDLTNFPPLSVCVLPLTLVLPWDYPDRDFGANGAGIEGSHWDGLLIRLIAWLLSVLKSRKSHVLAVAAMFREKNSRFTPLLREHLTLSSVT